MYELSGIMENVNYKDRMLPVVVDDTIRDDDFYVELVKHWKEKKDKQTEIVENDNGTVYITKETFENIILGITKNYPELKNVKVEINVSEEGVSTNIFAYILPDTILPELTSKVQNNIKSGVKKQTTVEIKEANIKVKGVYFEQSKQQNSK